MNHNYHILIVEPSAIITAGLTKILGETQTLQKISTLSDTTNLQERLFSIVPDLLIINPTLVGTQQRMLLGNYEQSHPKTAIMALIYQYIEPSALGFYHNLIDIRENPNKLIAAIQQTISTQRDEKSETESYELSQRETDVLVQVAKGLSSKEIADKLNISIHTVNTHRKNITTKTGIKSVAGLAVYAMLHNLVDKT